MIFIGVRDDLGIAPSHPGAESKPVTVREAISGVCIVERFHEGGSKLSIACHKLQPGQSADDLYPNWGFQLRRLSWNEVAPTISKSGGATGHIHPERPRKLQGREYARIASFPDRFQFVGQESPIQDRIGNSVPPLFMEAIARHIRQEILGKA